MTDDQPVAGAPDEAPEDKFVKVPVRIMNGTAILYFIQETEYGADITDVEGEPIIRLSVKGAAYVGGILAGIAAHHEHAEDA